MDFKSLLNKLDSMEAPAKGVAAPELPKAVQLDEGAQLRVLSGQSTILAESALMEKAAKNEVSAAEEKAARDKREEQKKKIAKIVDETSAKKMAKPMKKKEVEESLEGDLEEGWDEMVEEVEEKKAKFPTVADAKARAEKEKTTTTGKFDKKEMEPGVTRYTRKSSTFTDGSEDKPKNNKKDESVKEGAKPMTTVNGKKVPAFAADGKGKNDLSKGKHPAADEGEDKPSGEKGMSAKQEKFFGEKKAVKESVEGTLTFAKALQIIKESNGTAQIDPLDDNLWAWARRVAATKFNESVIADVYAATTYERMGGTWGIAQINE